MEVEDDKLPILCCMVSSARYALGLVPVAVRRLGMYTVQLRHRLDLPFNQFGLDWRKLHKPAFDVLRRGMDIGRVQYRREADGEKGFDGRAHEGHHEGPLKWPVPPRPQRRY